MAAAELQVWPAIWKIAGNREGQYTQFVLHDSEVSCFTLGVLRRNGAVMLAIPADFLDAECETLCGLQVFSRHGVSVPVGRRTC